MTPEPGHAWGEVIVGMYIRGKGDKTWRVDREMNGWIGLTARDGSAWTGPRPDPRTPVTILVPTLGEAVNTVERVLGGTVLGGS